MHWEGFSETVLKSSFTIEQKRGAHFLIGLIGVCVAKKGIAFGVSSLYKVFTILLLDFLNKKCFCKLWITLKQASVIYMNILLVTEWSCYAKINNKFLIIKGGGRKRILFLNKKRLFRPKLHTPTQTLCNTPSPLLWDTSVNTVYTTQWALGVWIFFVHYLHMWLSVKIFLQSINVWCALGFFLFHLILLSMRMCKSQ